MRTETLAAFGQPLIPAFADIMANLGFFAVLFMVATNAAVSKYTLVCAHDGPANHH